MDYWPLGIKPALIGPVVTVLSFELVFSSKYSWKIPSLRMFE